VSLEGPNSDDREAIEQLRAAFERAGFTLPAVERLLGLDDLFDRRPRDEPLYRRRAAGDGALGTLVRLFLLAEAVGREEAASALGSLTLERAERMGVLELGKESVGATVEIVPVHGLFVAGDQSRVRGVLPDHVLGFSPPTGVLGGLIVEQPVERALDLGTGGGYQALRAAGFARRVVAVDINPRALRFARFNARLNRAENLELREGDLFEPVAGETFDLAVCNPPYVISPDTSYVYRDSGRSGHSFCETVVRELPGFLAEGAYGIAMLTWAHGRDRAWAEPVRSWLDGSGCDAVLLRYASWDPLRYAATWNRGDDAESYSAALDRWTAYHRALGIERIAWGALALRRRSDTPNWFWAHTVSTDRVGEGSRHVLRLFAAQDFLRRVGGRRNLLGERLALSDDHRFEQSLRLGGLAGGQSATALRLDGGLGLRVELDALVVALLTRLRGDHSLGDVLDELAVSQEGVDREQLANAVLPAIASLVELGFVRPHDGRDA
jgi:SAM-dependent methyltransferase